MLSNNPIQVSLIRTFSKSFPLCLSASPYNSAVIQQKSTIQVSNELDLLTIDAKEYHSCAITLIKLSESKRQKLLSCSADAVVCWTLETAVPPITLATNLGHVEHAAFNRSESLVACCIGNNVHVFNICSATQICFEGHLGKTRACEFLQPHASLDCHDWLISVSEDRTFKSFCISCSLGRCWTNMYLSILYRVILCVYLFGN